MKTDKIAEWVETHQYENVLYVDVYYPRNNPVNAVILDLVDTRATNPIKILYDFDRNGWIILEQISFDEKTGDFGWKEHSFVEYKDISETPNINN